MEISEKKGFKRLRQIFMELEEFVILQQKKSSVEKEYIERDLLFLKNAKESIWSCDVERLKILLEEIRGLSQYFCSYCSDMEHLDQLLDELYNCVQETILELRVS